MSENAPPSASTEAALLTAPPESAGETEPRQAEPRSPDPRETQPAYPFAIDEASGDVFRRRSRRPLLGPSLVCFGTLLGAYVVFGDLVVSVGFPEGLAAIGVLGTFAATALSSGRQSLALLRAAPGTETLRLASPGLLGLALGIFAVLFVSVLPTSGGSSSDSVITLFLLAVGFTAAAFGYRLSGPSLRRPAAGVRALVTAGRIVGALVTVLVIARALTRL